MNDCGVRDYFGLYFEEYGFDRVIEIFQNMTMTHSKTRPDTRLPKSRAGGQGPYLRSPDHLGRSSEVKVIKT